MRILYLSQYFPPEAGATQTRAYEMARNLVRLGHQVTMLAEVPNHPAGIIPPEYRGRLYERANLEGIDVIRVWVKTSPVKSFGSRMLFYLTFMLNAFLAGLLLARGRYDAIYASSPPLFVGGAALGLSVLRRLPLVFEVRDLWPESAVALGELNNPRAIRWAQSLEEACYRRAKAIVVVTEGIRDRLVRRGIPSHKLVLIPNGANVELFRFQEELRMQVRAHHQLPDAFIAVYAGIHGVAQGLEVVLEAASLLRSEPGIHFFLIGEGPKKAELVEQSHRMHLDNVYLLPEQPRERIPAYLSAADAALIPLRNIDLFKSALPSKLFDAWACERPVLLSVDGEARRIVELAQGGLFVPPEDPAALAAQLLRLKSEPELRALMGRKGRQFTEAHYSRKAQAENLAVLLETITRQKG